MVNVAQQEKNKVIPNYTGSYFSFTLGVCTNDRISSLSVAMYTKMRTKCKVYAIRHWDDTDPLFGFRLASHFLYSYKQQRRLHFLFRKVAIQ